MNLPRQTLSYVRQLLEAHGIQPKNKLGQNFLVDLNLLDLLLRSAELDRPDLVLEVGSGSGSLTARLAEQAGAVLAIEIDPAFVELTRLTVGDQPSVIVLHADILAGKNELNPEVLARLDEMRTTQCYSRLKLVANLPYAVATPVISNFLLTSLPFERMVVTVQWEIAERLTAGPGTKEYGAVSVLVQSLADIELLRRLPASVFWPRPQVDSAFVRIWPRPNKREQVIERVGDVLRWRTFLRDLYVHRRKNLRGSLAGWPGGRRDKHEVDRKLAQLGIDGAVRAEQLDVETHLRLCAAFGESEKITP